LDPACGCGNFLIITYRELRRLELEVLKMRHSAGQMRFDITNLLKVGVGQFYGIELEDFPCQIAQVGMWLVDHQMNLRVSDHFGTYYARLPLRDTAHIKQGNALRLNWEELVPPAELSFIMGNPPFVGYSNQNPEQKDDILRVCNLGKIDYVAAWYFRAAKYIQGTEIRCAFVSTNSITQGEQVAGVWKPLTEQYKVHINFGVPTFKWSNEAKGKAAVHCVIVGFSLRETPEDLNPYLLKGSTVFITSRNRPICDVPHMVYGNKPSDGGHLFFTAEEYEDFIQREPLAEKYIRRFIGSEEYIKDIPRYVLWLAKANPGELKKMPFVMERVQNVNRMRLASKKEATRRSAETPTLFQENRQPTEGNLIIVPRHSSELRKYIPMGFLSHENIIGDSALFIPNAHLYHFAILTSSAHNAWMRAVCGRLKSDYRYSKDIVYNNFPWPDTTAEQRAQLDTLAQAVLDARAAFPEASLADLYDPLTMPPALLKAHQTLDRYVLKLYSFSPKMTEAEVVAGLMERYLRVTRGMLAE
jgi:hypothetical protein